MKEITQLLEEFWIVKDKNTTDYYRIKRSIDNQMKNFLTDFVGWKLFVTNKLIKLENFQQKHILSWVYKDLKA